MSEIKKNKEIIKNDKNIMIDKINMKKGLLKFSI